jgi:hypothetical protein
VGYDAVENISFLRFGQVQSRHKRPGQFSTFFGMTQRTPGFVLVTAADVVQVSRREKHRHIRSFPGADMAAEPNHPQGVLPIVAAPGIFELLAGKRFDKTYGGRIIRGDA